MHNCLIIEDEPLAAEILADYIREVPDLHLVATCRDVITASEYLRTKEVEVLFVDIHLPKINGIEFLKTVQNKYQVILTTAYHQYALDGYDLNVVDYLLKPIEFSRFLQAVNKIHSPKRQENQASAVNTDSPAYHFFNVDKRQVKAYHHDILYIESLKEYIKVHLSGQTLTTKIKIGEIESILQSNRFLRIHKSYVINLDRIQSYSASEIEIESIRLPIGRTYKEFVLKKLEAEK